MENLNLKNILIILGALFPALWLLAIHIILEMNDKNKK